MQKLKNELEQLKNDLGHLKIFCEAVADTHAQGKQLRKILNKEINGVEYKKDKPWHGDLMILHFEILQSLLAFDRRLTKMEGELES